MTCVRKLLAILSLIFCVIPPGVYLDGPSIHHLQEIYEKSSPGEMPCYYDGSLCKRGKEFCSTRSRTCEPLFPTGSTETMKLAICKDLLLKNETEQGSKDTCIYFLGDLESRKDEYKQSENNFQESHPLHDIGNEFCPFAEKYCQLGDEICNPMSKKCEPLFLPGATDEEKWQKCQEVLKKNVVLLRDGCMYALGLLGCRKTITTGTDQKDAVVSNEWAIPVTCILIVVIAIAAVAAICVLCKFKEMFCFKPEAKPAENFANREPRENQNLLPPVGDNENGHPMENDVNLEAAQNIHLRNNGDNENGGRHPMEGEGDVNIRVAEAVQFRNNGDNENGGRE